MTTPVAGRDTVQIDVTGVVQGVGFRPFVHRLAVKYGLAGWVRNDADAVRMEVQGSGPAIDGFVQALRSDAPPQARIDAIAVTPTTMGDVAGFQIVRSENRPDRRQPVAPDIALCADCERELLDPHDRRYRYPFITCTNCGPRFTVIDAMPYDRERTSMRTFGQCTACRAEYEDAPDRRFHSESNSCPDCGPGVWFEGSGADVTGGSNAAIMEAVGWLQAGRIVAIRGLGGFHLAVAARHERAVARLRERKGRESRPLAVMVLNVEDAARLGVVGETEARLLRSSERPIVLLKKHVDYDLAPSVAPGLDTIGVMTAYTPLHHLLLDGVNAPLVMTSGNASEQPIATANADARGRLATIADGFLMHDRDIVARYDDSVIRVVGDRPLVMRRARGYAPLPVQLPVPTPRPLVAVGPHLKNTFTIAHDRAAYVSQHIGDLANLETLTHFCDSLSMLSRLFRMQPEIAVRDLHSGYLSTQVADGLGLQTIAVQHHHAHVAAVAAEHGWTDRVVGVAFDGTGYGGDGAVWGAEILVADLCDYERVARLRYAPLPGGDLAARRPWRVALGYQSLDDGVAPAFARAYDGVDPIEFRLATQQVERKLNAPFASSMGRLFDAAAAVLGTRLVSHYEGQAAMELEALAGDRSGCVLPFPILEEDGVLILDPLPLLAALGERHAAGSDVRDLAADFHDSVAAATVAVVTRVAQRQGLRTVALGGGVFQNARLLASVVQGVERAGLEVLVPQLLSPNDGAISYGQAAVGAAQLARNGSR